MKCLSLWSSFTGAVAQRRFNTLVCVASRCCPVGCLRSTTPNTCRPKAWSICSYGAWRTRCSTLLNWNRYPQPWVFVVLALHKVFCTATWVWWLLYKKPVAVPPWEADLEHIWNKDPIVALFFATYGAADLGFACIFLQAAELA